MDNQQKFPLQTLNDRTCFVLDLDGVIYKGSKAEPGAVEAIQKLRKLGKTVLFLTNNSTKRPKSIAKKLESLGISCSPEEVMTSAEAASIFCYEKQIGAKSGVFVVGSEELREAIKENGIACSDPLTSDSHLVGFDPNFNYSTISDALNALNRGVSFLVCNSDASFPADNGQILPGCGAMVGGISGASQRKPDFQIGKPNRFGLDCLLAKSELSLKDCVIVGDGLESEIAMANSLHIPSVWISDNKTKTAHRNSNNLTVCPDFQFSSLKDLTDLL